MKAATALSAAAFVALMALAGCSSAGRTTGTSRDSGTVATQAPITVTTVPPAPDDSTVSVAPVAADSDQISAIESDLADVDSATVQADNDTGAADSAQAQSDNP